MAVLVKDKTFVPDDWHAGYVPLAALSDWPDGAGVDLSSPDLSARAWERLVTLLPRLELVRIRLRHFGDLAALDLAHAIRATGYDGRLRAHGAVLARAYTLIRCSGFSEVELDHAQASRQPAEHWRLDSAWQPIPLRGVWAPSPAPTRAPARAPVVRRGDADRG